MEASAAAGQQQQPPPQQQSMFSFAQFGEEQSGYLEPFRSQLQPQPQPQPQSDMFFNFLRDNGIEAEAEAVAEGEGEGGAADDLHLQIEQALTCATAFAPSSSHSRIQNGGTLLLSPGLLLGGLGLETDSVAAWPYGDIEPTTGTV